MSYEQQKLYFDEITERNNKFRGLLYGIKASHVGLSGARWGNVIECLISIHSNAGAYRDAVCEKFPADLVATSKLSRSVFFRARTDAVSAGLLHAERVRVPRGSKRRLPDRLSINHSALDRLAEQGRDTREQVGSSGTSRDQVGSGGITYRKPKELKNLKTKNPPPPSVTDDGNGDLRSQGDGSPRGGRDFELILKELCKLGVKSLAEVPWGKAEKAAREFVSAGGTIAEFEAIAEVYRNAEQPSPPAWGPGALPIRLGRWYQGCDPAAEWPPESEGHERAKSDLRKQEELRSDEKRLVLIRTEKKKRSAESTVRDQLAIRVAGLSEAERREILDQRFPEWRNLRIQSTNQMLLSYFTAEFAERCSQNSLAQSR